MLPAKAEKLSGPELAQEAVFSRKLSFLGSCLF